MRHPSLTPRLAVALLLTATACGGDPPAPPATVEEAMKQAGEAMANAAAGGTEPLSAEQLQERLPERLSGFARGETERQDLGAMGVKMSMAKADYADGDRRIQVSITDVGTAAAMAPMAAGWAMVDFDRTTGTGYERTIRFEGYKGHEELNSSGGRVRTELSLLVGDRIVVQLKGTGVEMDDLKKAASDLGLRNLARAN